MIDRFKLDELLMEKCWQMEMTMILGILQKSKRLTSTSADSGFSTPLRLMIVDCVTVVYWRVDGDVSTLDALSMLMPLLVLLSALFVALLFSPSLPVKSPKFIVISLKFWYVLNYDLDFGFQNHKLVLALFWIFRLRTSQFEWYEKFWGSIFFLIKFVFCFCS